MKKYKFDVFASFYLIFLFLLNSPALIGLIFTSFFYSDNPLKLLMFFIAIPLILAGVAFLGMHFPIQENPELYMDQYSIIFVEDGIKKSVNISDITYIKLYPGAHGKGYKGYRRSSYVALYDHETKILKIKYPSFQFLYDLKHYAPSAKFRLSSLFFDIICAVVTLLLCVFLCYIMVTDGKLFKDIFDNYRNSL